MTKYFQQFAFATLLLISSFSAICQNGQIEKFWIKEPVYETIDSNLKDENVIGLCVNEQYEYYYDASDKLIADHIIHKKFRINDDKSINDFNKISIALNDVIEIKTIKARAIKPDGSIVNFDEKSIKEIENEEGSSNLKIFTIDGIEVGDDVEYVVYRILTGINFGRSYFQFSYPLQQATFTLISPNNLFFDIKGYNGFPNGIQSKIEPDKNKCVCELRNIPAIKSEKFAYTNPLKSRIDFRLDYNTALSNSQRLTWDDAAQKIYGNIYLNINSKHIDKWVKEINCKAKDKAEIANYIENYIKENIFIQEFYKDEFSDINYILENKVSSESGIINVYANLFKYYKINHQIVLTTERDQIKFDGSFQSWNYLSRYLIYLPDENMYIDPSATAYRNGYVSGTLTANYGLFIELVNIGDFESAIGIIKYIEPLPCTANYDNMDIDISIDLANISTNIKTTRGLKGLSGGSIARIYPTLDEEQKQNLLKDLSATKAPNAVYNALKIQPTSDLPILTDAEFILYSDLTTPTFIEQAGNKLLFKIGETIGPQIEMYFEENRISTVENEFNRSYIRKIKFIVPEGYKIINPEDATMYFGDKTNNKVNYLFESKYTYNGNEYQIEINEFYNSIYASKEQFEAFKAVVNAAADFNKIVLILSKN